jgi:hypothetical protein
MARGPEERTRAIPENQEAVRERYYDVYQSVYPGIFVMAEHGARPNMTRSQLIELMLLNNAFVLTSDTIKDLQASLEDPRMTFRNTGIDVEGFRGVRDVSSGFETQVNPNRQTVFDMKLIRQSAGEKVKEVLHRKTTITVVLDPDVDDVDGFVTSMRRRLKRQGKTAEEVRKMVEPKESFRVDVSALRKLVKDGEITLLPGAMAVGIVDWDVVPRIIISALDIAAAREKTGLISEDPTS